MASLFYFFYKKGIKKMNYDKKVPFEMRRNHEHYLDLTAGRAIDNLNNDKTFINKLGMKLGDQIRARFNIYWNGPDLEIEIKNFEFQYLTTFHNIRDSVGKKFLIHYIVTETVRRYRNQVNKLFFRNKDYYI